MSKKKANGEGSISKRSDGRYMARYTVDGKRKAIYGATHEDVRTKLNEILNEIAKGLYIPPKKDTVGMWLREWLVTYALPTVKQSTYISYEGYVRIHLEPELGHIKLTSLTTEEIQRFFNKKYRGYKGSKGLSPKTLKNMYNMFNSTLEQAVINNRLIRNPLRGVKLPSTTKREIDILSAEEQKALQKAAAFSEELPAFGVILTLSTGVRLGELLGFQWGDINMKKHTIRVKRTVGRLQKVDEDGNLMSKGSGKATTELVVRSPKSITSQREIPLFDELWNELMTYRDKQRETLDAFGVTFTDTTHIFCMPTGRVYDPRTYEDLFKRTLKAADLPSINFHALRHTFATRALEAGMDVKVLSSILGHAQASTTLNLYAHALPDHKRDSMEKMRSFYGTDFDTNEDNHEDDEVTIITI